MDYKFEHHWGGEEMWYHKAERWANKQKFPINHLALGFITWLKEKWIEGKVEMEMASVDKQSEEIKKQWEEKEESNIVVKSTPSEVKGLDNISIVHKAFIPNPWDSDWNDVGVNYKSWSKNESSIERTSESK